MSPVFNQLQWLVSAALVCVVIFSCLTAALQPRRFTIGGVLSSAQHERVFNRTIQELNNNDQFVSAMTQLDVATIRMDENPIRTALSVCRHLVSSQVYAMVVSHPHVGDIPPASVSYTSGFYHIPVIGITSRDSAFSDKNIHGSFLRTVPPYAHQSDVWVDLLKLLGFRQVIFLHSSDADGRSVSNRFLAIVQSLHTSDYHFKVEDVIEFEPGLKSFRDELLKLKEWQSRVYLLYASENDSRVIFHDAAFLNMTETGYVWIVTEQALRASTVPEGILGFRLSAPEENKHIKDSLRIVALALNKMSATGNVTDAPRDCNNTGEGWDTGRRLYKYIQQQILYDGQTGKVTFDDNGDRINAEYELVNIDSRRRRQIVGAYAFSKELGRMHLTLDTNTIVWPGGSNVQPKGVQIPTHLRVLTLNERPFVYSRQLMPPETMCHADETLCPRDNLEQGVIDFCCSGYCIDLLKELSVKVNFTFDLVLSSDGEFGSYYHDNVTGQKQWTGMIGELKAERADMIAAPLTINPERAEAIDFSKPFKYQGITILERRQPRAPTLVSFLQPFRHTLWILVLVSVHVVALVLYLLDRFSPFGRQASRFAHSANFRNSSLPSKVPPATSSPLAEEESLNLSSAMWFAYGVLLNSGIGDGTPRSFSARVLGMVWAGFAMIIIASYTANLAAFLVLDRPRMRLTGINDARLRNPIENFSYATVKGSAVDMYFRRQVELSNMYRTMEDNHYTTADDAIKAVKNGTLNAFIWDSSRVEYEATQDCKLVTSGELFGRSGYGIGLKHDSPWARYVTLAILQFHESGFMEQLDNAWIFQNRKECEAREKTPVTLGLENMAGVFILVLAGIVGGCALIVVEITYKRHRIRQQRRIEIVRRATDRWRCTVERRRLMRVSRYGRYGVPPPAVIGGPHSETFSSRLSSCHTWSSPDVRQQELLMPPLPARVLQARHSRSVMMMDA